MYNDVSGFLFSLNIASSLAGAAGATLSIDIDQEKSE